MCFVRHPFYRLHQAFRLDLIQKKCYRIKTPISNCFDKLLQENIVIYVLLFLNSIFHLCKNKLKSLVFIKEFKNGWHELEMLLVCGCCLFSPSPSSTWEGDVFLLFIVESIQPMTASHRLNYFA